MDTPSIGCTIKEPPSGGGTTVPIQQEPPNCPLAASRAVSHTVYDPPPLPKPHGSTSKCGVRHPVVGWTGTSEYQACVKEGMVMAPTRPACSAFSVRRSSAFSRDVVLVRSMPRDILTRSAVPLTRPSSHLMTTRSARGVYSEPCEGSPFAVVGPSAKKMRLSVAG